MNFTKDWLHHFGETPPAVCTTGFTIAAGRQRIENASAVMTMNLPFESTPQMVKEVIYYFQSSHSKSENFIQFHQNY